MPSTAIARVNCIMLAGADARRFAQAQFSGNLDTLTPGHWQWNAWLDAQGRVRLLMHLLDLGDDALLVVPRGGNIEAIRADLTHYLVRARVTLTPAAFAGYAGGPMPQGVVLTEQHALVLGYCDRSLRLNPTDRWVPDLAAQAAWRRADIRAGWPSLPGGDALFFSPALGLERLGAIAYDKGCYPGQEIAARLHYRGGHKLRLHHVRGTGPLPVGEALESTTGARVWVLDCVPNEDAVDALIVASEKISMQFNIEQSTFNVISTFDA